MSSATPLALVTSAAKGRVLYSAPGRADPLKLALDPFPIEGQGYRSSQACPPSACLLSGSHSTYSPPESSAWNPEGLVPCLEPCRRCHLSTAHPDAPGETFRPLPGEDRASGEKRLQRRVRAQALSAVILPSFLQVHPWVAHPAPVGVVIGPTCRVVRGRWDLAIPSTC